MTHIERAPEALLKTGLQEAPPIKIGHLRGKKVSEIDSSEMDLRIMLALLEWANTMQDYEKILSDKQDKGKEKHWKSVEELEQKMRTTTYLQPTLQCAGAVFSGLSAWAGYKAGLVAEHEREVWTRLAGVFSGVGNFPNSLADAARQTRDASVETLRSKVQRDEKKAQSQEKQKVDRDLDGIMSTIKQLLQIASQRNESVNSLGKGH